jgi:F-type H+-transporting ATPase subunit a
MTFNTFFSPFEQFIVTPILPLNFIFFDFTITNATVVLFILVCGTAYFFLILRNPNTNSLYLNPTVIDSHFHLAYIAVQTILEKHVHVKYYQQIMFPITFSLAIFLLMLNLGGNLPIFMSLTSQFAIISAFSLPTIIGIFCWLAYDRELTFFRTFHAPGMSSSLAMVLFPIEVLTYVMRPVSIICRLCSNIMSGHIIVKVCLHTMFDLSVVKGSSNFFLSILVSSLVFGLVPLLILEVAVSVIQVYVFLVIFCMFLADTFGHHFRH